MKMFKKITQRIHRIVSAFKNKPVDKITIGVDVRDCASCEYKLRCAECSLSAENARLRAEIASFRNSETTIGTIRQSMDEADKPRDFLEKTLTDWAEALEGKDFGKYKVIVVADGTKSDEPDESGEYGTTGEDV